MHRDLKPENIFFTTLSGQEEGESMGSERKKVKLGDFGFCKGLKPDENLAKTMLGSPIYMAPEVLKGESYTTKADIWSLGVILFEMLYGYCPFESRSIASLINTIDTQPVQLPNNIPVSEKTQNLIKRMLAKDYFRRIGWVELFGIRIDENGEYVEEGGSGIEERGSTPNKNKYGLLFGSVPLDSVSLAGNSRSFSAIRDEDNDKIRHSFKQ
jgi:serine/threonine-protein kinase ULK/ATG1